jgi:beta-carotene hydroxylase
MSTPGGRFSRASVPRHLLRTSPWRKIALFLRGVAIWALPGLAAFTILRAWGPAFVWLTIPLFFVAGQGLHLIAFIGHEGLHGHLHRRRVPSLLIGMLASTITPLHCDVGFCISHLEHHRSLNSEEDPDARRFSKANSVLERIFLVRQTVTRKYLGDTLLLAFRRWPEEKPLRIGLPMETVVRLARVNLALSAAWFTFFVALTVHDPLLGFCMMWGPSIGGALLSSMRPFVEHAGTTGGKLSGARSYTHPLWTFFFDGANFHLAHHLFPDAPCYRLPALHAYLAENGAYDGGELHIESTFAGYFACLRAPYPTPEKRALELAREPSQS